MNSLNREFKALTVAVTAASFLLLISFAAEARRGDVRQDFSCGDLVTVGLGGSVEMVAKFSQTLRNGEPNRSEWDVDVDVRDVPGIPNRATADFTVAGDPVTDATLRLKREPGANDDYIADLNLRGVGLGAGDVTVYIAAIDIMLHCDVAP